MNSENYAPCSVRLSQGDIVRAPIGVFSRTADLADPSMLDAIDSPVALGDPRGLAARVPSLWVGQTRAVLRAWYLPAVVVSPDCGIDKEPAQVLVAPILPLSAADPASRDGLRAGTFLTALALPAEADLQLADDTCVAFPDSFVDLTRTTAVAPGLLRDERMVALSDSQLDRFQEAWVRFVALRELSSTGTLAAAAGRRIREVTTVGSSQRRHTIVFTFDDDSIVVLYQEPRRRGDHLQSVRIKDGAFTPSEIRALVSTNLVLRFESEDRRDWNISCKAAGLEPRRVLPSATTEVLIRCPDEPCELILINTDKRSAALRILITDPAARP